MRGQYACVFFLLIFLLLSVSSQVSAEWYLGAGGARNGGEHIFETGNKYPNLSGFKGGSRITYDRNYNFGILEGGYFSEKFSFQARVFGTGWTVRTANSRDEDFFLGQISSEKGNKFSVFPPNLNDTAHTFTGTQNFADGHAKSTVNERGTEMYFKYYFGGASAGPFGQNDGFYAGIGFRYNYFKYQLYDVVQWIGSRPVFYGFIGNGLSYSYSTVETPLGGGYQTHFSKFRFDNSLYYIPLSYSKFRDFHVQRALNFIGYGYGNGFIFRSELSYIHDESNSVKLAFEGHRQFTYAQFNTKGGLSNDDILSNFLGNFRSYITTKEAYLSLSYIRKI